MKTLYVRVQPKSGQKTFFRCGMPFDREWKTVDVDDATAARLQAEQMLEVAESVEEAFEPVPADAITQLSVPVKEASAPQATEPADAAAPADAPAKAGKSGK